MKTLILVVCALAPAIMLVGCVEAHTAVTSDDVLAEQYRARTPRGALTGPEATVIADSYHRQIAAPPGALASDLPASR